jgi:hypothetical protein
MQVVNVPYARFDLIINFSDDARVVQVIRPGSESTSRLLKFK